MTDICGDFGWRVELRKRRDDWHLWGFWLASRVAHQQQFENYRWLLRASLRGSCRRWQMCDNSFCVLVIVLLFHQREALGRVHLGLHKIYGEGCKLFSHEIPICISSSCCVLRLHLLCAPRLEWFYCVRFAECPIHCCNGRHWCFWQFRKVVGPAVIDISVCRSLTSRLWARFALVLSGHLEC